MNESPRDAKRDSDTRANSDSRTEKRTVETQRPATMPNPVKGLQLSLYPIIREH